jgi:hypothetical protein
MMLDEIYDDLLDNNAVDVVAVLQNNSNASNNDGLIPQLSLSVETATATPSNSLKMKMG